MSKSERVFTCETCDISNMDTDQLRKHLEEAHGVTGVGKGMRQMISHIDGRDRYGSVYRWELEGGVVVIESVTVEREKYDSMRFYAP